MGELLFDCDFICIRGWRSTSLRGTPKNSRGWDGRQKCRPAIFRKEQGIRASRNPPYNWNKCQIMASQTIPSKEPHLIGLVYIAVYAPRHCWKQLNNYLQLAEFNTMVYSQGKRWKEPLPKSLSSKVTKAAPPCNTKGFKIVREKIHFTKKINYSAK